LIDLHNHLLPGIDDGAKRLEETLQFLRIALTDGVRTVVATPHMKPGVYDNRRVTILESVAMVREAQRGSDTEGVTLLPGAEVYFTADVVRQAKAGELMTVADRGKFLLLELPYQQIPMRVEDTIFQLKILGITPIMAHPERVAYYLEDMERVVTSVRLGALTQVTGASITGRFGSKAREFAHEMLERGLVHVVASDSHDVSYRPPTLSDAVRTVAQICGEAAARRMVEDTPRAILDGLEVEIGEPQEALSKGFLARVRSIFRGRRRPV
jgi:protein-tyrosine phosphatase